MNSIKVLIWHIKLYNKIAYSSVSTNNFLIRKTTQSSLTVSLNFLYFLSEFFFYLKLNVILKMDQKIVHLKILKNFRKPRQIFLKTFGNPRADYISYG